MSRAIGALAVGGVGAAMVASNSLYTGEFDNGYTVYSIQYSLYSIDYTVYFETSCDTICDTSI